MYPLFKFPQGGKDEQTRRFEDIPRLNIPVKRKLWVGALLPPVGEGWEGGNFIPNSLPTLFVELEISEY
jgi:hypothetical protein